MNNAARATDKQIAECRDYLASVTRANALARSDTTRINNLAGLGRQFAFVLGALEAERRQSQVADESWERAEKRAAWFAAKAEWLEGQAKTAFDDALRLNLLTVTSAELARDNEALKAHLKRLMGALYDAAAHIATYEYRDAYGVAVVHTDGLKTILARGQG